MKSKITLKTLGIISCAVLLSLALSGCVVAHEKPSSTSGSEQPIDEKTESIATNSTSQPLANVTESYIDESEAKAIAFAHAGMKETDVSNLLCKLDYDDGIAEYEVEFWDGATEYDYEIDAVSGEIIGYDYDMESYDAKPATTPNTLATTDYIGEAEAKGIALAHAGVTESEAGHIKCEFDYDDGYAEYEIEWKIGRTEYEYTISATDSTILEYNVEYDD